MLKIRLRRGGAAHSPYYRIVVSDSLNTPRASTVEEVGFYDPKKNPAQFRVDTERVNYWLSRGAKMSDTVRSLMKKQS